MQKLPKIIDKQGRDTVSCVIYLLLLNLQILDIKEGG